MSYRSWLTGSAGVNVFFIISGFIVASSAEGRTPIEFIRSRTSRILPALWICCSLTFLAQCISDGISFPLLRRFLASALFIPVVPWSGVLSDMWVERVYWTLFVEAGFYLMIFLLLAFDRFNDIARVATCLGIISLVYWTLFFASLHYIFPGSEWLRGSAFKRYLDLSLIHHGPWFALGINVWLAQRTGYGARAVSILIAVIGGCLQGAHHSLFETKLEPMYEIAFSLVGFMCVAGAACHHTRFTVNNVTASLYRKIGIATYPLYLLHDYIGKKIIYDSGLFPSSAGKVAASCVIAALMVWLALTIAGVVEPVVKTWFLRSFDRFQDTLKRTQKVDFVFRRSTPLQPL